MPQRLRTLLAVGSSLALLLAGCSPGPTPSATSVPATSAAAATAAPTVAPTGAAALTAAPTGTADRPPIDPQISTCNTTKPPTDAGAALERGLLSRDLPCDATLVAPFDLDNLQLGFDFYSWLTFAALNAPAEGAGVIGSGGQPGGDAPTVWEQWQSFENIMLPDGAAPPAWGQTAPIPAVCQSQGDGMLLRMVGKTPNLIEAADQPFKTGPLIDQNGAFVRYDILVNRPMYEYIVQNTLYSSAGQSAFVKRQKVDFPAGSVISGTTTGTVGAIMVKSAWKIMGAGDDPARFHTARALVYTPATANPPVKESCAPQQVGLVGLHIAHKTKDAPQWLWSTFEHRDNVPSQAQVGAGQAGGRYNFYRADCPAATCPVNEPPPRPWDPNQQPFRGGFTSQIVRLISLTQEVEQLNRSFQGLLKGTVWEHYQLISTQWPTDAKSTTDPTGAPAPQFLGNSTMETYIQGQVPLSSSSCMDCHNNAADTQGAFSDFTYILERAGPKR